MSEQNNSLQAKIDRTTAKLAALKAQQQAREAREKARRTGEARAIRNRALMLWGVALERAMLATPKRIDSLRTILEEHLTRENERTAALSFLDAIRPASTHQSEESTDEK
ncbi:hypothetical protein [Dyella flagellata]|uniref:Mobilization protein n=1 Tax=Dyella flagellata TaxID=1867833 RepID=A0ABQ5XER2_9GAMM|nr:hypothetical protein [Dyella flagellata]GLQ89588.1 hypothetical protein GCM10007898_31630 [Dyella flagellata]